MKYKLEGIKRRLNDAEECISELENRIVEITEAQQKKRKRINKRKGKRIKGNGDSFAMA